MDLVSRTLILCLAFVIVYDCKALDPKKNVLFIVVDDLRPELPAFKGAETIVKTTNIDDLAAKSIVLKQTYVQYSVCGPSRTSALTGRRPDTTLVYDLSTYWRTDGGGNFTTIPQYFKDQGYRTAGLGKLFHPGSASGYDDPLSWSDTYFHAPNKRKWGIDDSWKAVTVAEELADPLPDTQLADEAINRLQDMQASALNGIQPFFLSVGFHKPHLPFVFPEKYLNWYSNVNLPDNPYAPVDMPSAAWNTYGELRAYQDITGTGDINTTLSDSKTTELRRAYYASVSYIDEQIGRILGELERLNLSNNTVISFWGDHGFSLGEHGEWCKITNFEESTRIPMMLHVPGRTDAGIVTEKLVELVDLFPSIVDAADLPAVTQCPDNSSAVALCTEGTSFIPLISDANRSWKTGAFSQIQTKVNGINSMGYSIKTSEYRYTEFVKYNVKTKSINWRQLYHAELYDHTIDSEENVNRADHASYSTIRTGLSSKLRAGWKNDIPTI